MPQPLSFLFIASNLGAGGSERLWTQTAAVLAARGHRVKGYVAWSPAYRPQRRELRAQGVRTVSLALPLVSNKVFSLIANHLSGFGRVYSALRLLIGLAFSRKPDLVLVSQGGNYDGVILANICRLMGQSCLVLSHKASELHWPPDSIRAHARRMYEEAPWSFFVSTRNHTLTEEQLGCEIPRWTLVRNPFAVPWNARPAWPAGDEVRLACVGRLHVRDKGQDALLRVLALDKWRQRPLSVTFYGDGAQARSLRELAENMGLKSVHFAGVTNDPAAIWAAHAGLVLPSRAEGLPMAIVEAMLSNRVVITTDAGGNAELIEDGRTGFVAAFASPERIDETLERAWARRGEWQAIGAAAGASAREMLEEQPAEAFADMLEERGAISPAR